MFQKKTCPIGTDGQSLERGANSVKRVFFNRKYATLTIKQN